MPTQRDLVTVYTPGHNIVGSCMHDDSVQGFLEFFDREYSLVVAFLRKAGFEHHFADDVTAQAMTLAYSQWAKIRTNPRGWIRTAAYRLAAKTAEVLRNEIPRLVGKGYGSFVDDGTASYRRVEQLDELLRVLSPLPRRQRLVMALHLDGFSDTEIAEIAGIRPATVRSNLRHGRDALRKIIGDTRKAQR
jgi:RNA polymerase sigma-70 factor (ECF subfamily)